ncbi:division plane positioning ATPase MipZ [Streptomyces sp. NPDC093071]|uniref:division plane positioning ATPase MipZ n=1 Tax=Streptomyces sp. NPDC093071 TaxID=3366022 RepID=UPI003818CD25
MTRIHRWALISVKPGVGRSTSGIFLGQALYERDLSPLLVDADKGQTCHRWDELAGGMPYPVVSKTSRSLDKTLPDLEDGRGAVLIDTPQIEDHAAIARGAMIYADRWIMPLAPSVVEVDRMFADDNDNGKDVLGDFLEDAQELRERAGRPRADVVVLLTRTNTKKATKNGPDADVREALAGRGYETLTAQVPHNDNLYRQSGGSRVRAMGTAYERVLKELLARPYTDEVRLPSQQSAGAHTDEAAR